MFNSASIGSHIARALLHNLKTMNALLRRIHPDVIVTLLYVIVIAFAVIAWHNSF